MRLINIYVGAAILLSLLCLSGCGPDETTSNLSENSAVSNVSRSNIVISFVDLTGSIDNDTAEAVKRKVELLFSDLPKNSVFFVYPVDFGANIQPIFNYQDRNCEIKRNSDKERCEKQFSDDKAVAVEALKTELANYQNKMALPENKKLDNSCLVNKLTTTNNLVRSKYNSDDYRISLIFFSDMIEDCSESFNGKPVSFEQPEKIELINTQIEKELLINKDAVNLKNLKVTPIIINTIRKDKMPFDRLQELWDAVFVKYGFEKGDALKFYWTTELPDSKFWNLKEKS